jgi:hypothetical protein
MLRKHLISVVVGVFALAYATSLTQAQQNQLPLEALTNHQIVEMVRAKVPTDMSHLNLNS